MYTYDDRLKRIRNNRVRMVDIVFILLKRWRRVLLLSFFIFLCIASVLIIDYRADLNAPEETIIIDDLSVSEQNNIDGVLMLYDELDEMLDYKFSSGLLEMDPYNSHIMLSQYSIEASKETVEQLDDLYSSYIMHGDLISDPEKDSDRYNVDELITVVKENGSTLIWDESIENDKRIISIKVVSASRQKNEEFETQIKEKLSTYQKQLEKLYGEHELQFLGTTYYVGFEATVQSRQQEIEKLIIEKRTQITNAETLLSEVEKQQLKYQLGTASIPVIEEPTFPLTFLLLGVLVSMFMSILIVFLFYIIDKKIKNEEELQSLFDIDVIGLVSSKGKISNPIDKVIYLLERKIYNRENTEIQYSILKNSLQVYLKNRSIKKVFVSLIDVSTDNAILEKLKNDMKKENIEIEFGNSILKDANSILNSNECQNMMICVQKNKSLYNDVLKTVLATDKLKINMMGCIVFLD